MDPEVLAAVKTLFEALEGGRHLAVGVAGTMLGVWAIRALAPRATDARWPWFRGVAQWVSTGCGGVATSAAVSLLALLLPATMRGPVTWAVLGDVVLAWLAAMGAWSALKNTSPRVSEWSRARKTRALQGGNAAAAVAFACVLFASAAQAEDVTRATLLGRSREVATFALATPSEQKPPSLADVFAPGLLVGVSWEPRAEMAVPYVGVVGSVALFELLGRPLSLLAAMGAGTGAGTGEGEVRPLAGLGASWAIRAGGPITASLALVATYAKGGWGVSVGFTFDFLLTGARPREPAPSPTPAPDPPAPS
jgi:hypothetical protein